MATQAYGKTWWGAQWLNALTHIDYDNRLPRGRTYANRGAVTRLEVREGRIRAQVKGSRPQPYQVEVDVPPMSPAHTQALVEALIRDPLIISRMLNRELDPAVLEQARSLGIAVFPAHWKDLSMRCSCPDWAVPCKHIAAVIYLVSREIDGNPFLVFSLRGVDLIESLRERHIIIAREAQAALPSVEMLCGEPAKAVTVSPPPWEGAPATHFAFDYTTLSDIGSDLIHVLPASPTFFPQGDFKAMYEKGLKRVARQARRALEFPIEADISMAWDAEEAPRLEVDAHYQAILRGHSQCADWSALVAALGSLNEADLPDLQPSATHFYHVRMAALQLIAHGAVVPQIFTLPKGEIALRWLPAVMDEQVRLLLEQLGVFLPQGLLVYWSGRAVVELSGVHQALTLCSLMLDKHIWLGADMDRDKSATSKVSTLFFGSLRGRFDGPGEGAIPSGIQVWLSRLHLGQHPQAPVLWLEETASGFALTLGVETRDSPLGGKPVPFADFLTEPTWEDSRYRVLQTVSLLAEYFTPLQNYIRDGGIMPVALTPEALPTFLLDTLPTIRLLGIRVVLPKALSNLLRPRLSVRLQGKKGTSTGVLHIDELFRFDWTVAIGDHQLSRTDFEALVTTAHGVVRFRGEYVLLDPAEIEQLRVQLEKPAVPSGHELLRIALAEEYAGSPIVLDETARALLHRLSEIGDLPPPVGLHATLRAYQERGFAWLYRNFRAGLGSVIADDMGLGKTLQVISLLCQLKEEGELDSAKALVIVPTSLLTNWTKEMARFAPHLTTGIFHGVTRVLESARPDVLLTTYGVIRSDAARIKKASWRVVIIDEAQNIKNPTAAQTKAVKAIPARSFIAMSGTPVENRLSEFWSIMDFANRGLLGPLPRFTKEFAVPIQNDHNRKVIQRFLKITAPFLLRRLKSDKQIIRDLPDKIEQDDYTTLTREQAAVYESVVRESLRVISGESDTFQRQGLVLQMILALKQICNHPAQYLKQGGKSASLSGKAELLLDLLDPIVANHEKCLIFTQFREMGTLLAAWIHEHTGRAPQFLHGGVSRKNRDTMVERFQQDPTERVLILSLKAGGTGLNLTAASHVIHYDLWWNPAVEAQATDRAYRIGQQRNVQVHRLITRATFEERINEMMQSKRDLADLTVGTGEQWIGSMSNAELKDVFSLG
ncbi:DEAD/DEAH box helicase [Acidithiobacillus thiooxidans]|uniref:DEAD/DEAH box helicase n=1 Tax=Acidithiobacillus thiooxidans TaxID=930 RepID=UPI002863788F|nr:DEAD/DEAH box helicase [Acidithiobacillus thiooxidans]MDR7927178.1 DEAD/DEAH box helicase [Acidithiobacillus thiooxidans]